MSEELQAPVVAASLLIGMLLSLELGWRLGRARRRRDPDREDSGTVAVDAAVFALLGLLTAFTFSGAAARFDTRRDLITQEANDIGTAYLRLDLLRADAQPALRELFRKYLDSRLDVYRKLPNVEAAEAELARSAGLQREIWSQAVAACEAKVDAASKTLLLSALNDMFDITTKRTMAARTHPPKIIFILLFAMALACSLLAGHGMSRHATRSWLHMAGFALILATSIFVIMDMEHPRAGWIRVDAADQVLIDLRQSMN